MRDPFPLPPLPWLSSQISPLAQRYGLLTLPLHIHEVLFFALFYTAAQTVVSPRLSAALFPRHYSRLSARNRVNWDIHVVSLLQSVLVCILALGIMRGDDGRSDMDRPGGPHGGLLDFWRSPGFEERVWGYTGALGLVQASGCGYFLWDLVISAVHVDMFGVGMLAHAVSALTVFAFGFRPFVNYYAPTFILYELSSPFLNVHWFCDKLDLTGSTVQLINGFALLASFAGCRLVWGSWQSLRVLADVVRAARAGGVTMGFSPALNATAPSFPAPSDKDVLRFARTPDGKLPPLPLWLAAAYLGANITLNGLNWYWFGKMIATIRKRFPPPIGTKGLPRAHRRRRSRKEEPLQPAAADHGASSAVVASTATARRARADGVKSVQVESVEVKHVDAGAQVEANGEAKGPADGVAAGGKDGFLAVPERRDDGSSEDETMVP